MWDVRYILCCFSNVPTGIDLWNFRTFIYLFISLLSFALFTEDLCPSVAAHLLKIHLANLLYSSWSLRRSFSKRISYQNSVCTPCLPPMRVTCPADRIILNFAILTMLQTLIIIIKQPCSLSVFLLISY